jgi:hypothetical protein
LETKQFSAGSKRTEEKVVRNKMAISYAAIRNHKAKVALPSVEGGWYINSNIMRDPPKAVHTRRRDRVGDTDAVNREVEAAPDRQCEAISYYARGVNPMVSVDYGQGQQGAGTGNGCSGGAQAFLPHRIAREGAFRPPVREGVTSLLPLSRLPRVWTEVTASPYKPMFTKRLQECGTAEQTREVRNDILRMSCVAQKAVQTYPDLFAPSTKLQIRDSPILCENVVAAPSCYDFGAEVVQRNTQTITPLPPSRPTTSVTTNKRIMKETPIVFNNVQLRPTRPGIPATTSLSAPALATSAFHTPVFTRLPERRQLGGFEGYKQLPVVEKTNLSYTLRAPGLKTAQRR